MKFKFLIIFPPLSYIFSTVHIQLKELDTKFSEFENAAIQREKDYRNVIEQQRLDGEQLKGFEKLKDANLELRAVRQSPIYTFPLFYQVLKI